ncbi:MAG: hypothetical protein IPJ76_03995 [Flavobacteriales bacterium]|nr:MAG: hypothetical protein IPJ76_03995 [Flavobacteriales bacterium]
MAHASFAERSVYWLARVTGTLLLGFLLFMLFGHLSGDANGPNAWEFNNKADMLSFLLFPVCTSIGLALAYKWELLGGALVVLSLAGLLVLRPDLLRPQFLWLAVPGLLYVVHAMVARRART